MSSDPSASTAPAAGDIAIRVRDVSKRYVLFDRPEDRFKQMVVPRLERLVGRPPRRYYRDFAALSGVSFEIGRGETVGVVGRNGSGKSTLLQIVCGTLQPTAGSVEVNGRIAALLELGAGFNPEFTGRENVMLNASILGVPRREMEWRFDDIARFADIGPFLDQPVKTYSSGMYMRLAFATAVNVDPDILVVDEALAVGDEAFQRKCFARIEDIKDKGGTILFVSHGAQTIVQLCTRAMLIDAGELILQGRPRGVVLQYQRLVNASPEGVSEIRAGIVAACDGDVATAEPVPESVTIPGNGRLDSRKHDAAFQPVLAPQKLETEPPKLGYADYFDPSLKSESIVELEERGARIRGMQVLTLTGSPVNVLQLGKRYALQFLAEFKVPAKQVAFGMALKTRTGLLLAGATNTHVPLQRISSVEAGSVSIVRFEFNCLMLPGTYFLGCAIYGQSRLGDNLMHRVVDALAIRVAPEPDLLTGGHFDLGASLEVTRKQDMSLISEGR